MDMGQCAARLIMADIAEIDGFSSGNNSYGEDDIGIITYNGSQSSG